MPPAEPCPPCEEDVASCGDVQEQTCVEWPFTLLQPQHVGVNQAFGNVGGGRSIAGNNENVGPTKAGFWTFRYNGVRINNRAQVLKIREFEALLEGGGGVVCLHVYEGKRAPWLVVGQTIVTSAAGAFAAEGDSGSIRVTSGGVLLPGMIFSYNDRLYQLKTVGTPSGTPLIYPVSIWPPAREMIPDNSALNFERPTCRARLADDLGLSARLHLLQHANLNIDFHEDF